MQELREQGCGNRQQKHLAIMNEVTTLERIVEKLEHLYEEITPPVSKNEKIEKDLSIKERQLTLVEVLDLLPELLVSLGKRMDMTIHAIRNDIL